MLLLEEIWDHLWPFFHYGATYVLKTPPFTRKHVLVVETLIITSKRFHGRFAKYSPPDTHIVVVLIISIVQQRMCNEKPIVPPETNDDDTLASPW